MLCRHRTNRKEIDKTMEKKFYVAPALEEQLFEMEGFLCASDGTGDTTDQDAPILPGEGSTEDLG